jgi:hypothetical protein
VKSLKFLAILLALATVQPHANSAFVQSKVYTFTSKQLFPNPQDLKSFLEPGIQNIKGRILDVSAETTSIIRIEVSKGDQYNVFFYPDLCSTQTRTDLILALKAGRRIEAQVATAGASTLNLISAKIYL